MYFRASNNAMLSVQIDDIAIGVDVNYIIPDSYDDAVFLAVRDYARTRTMPSSSATPTATKSHRFR